MGLLPDFESSICRAEVGNSSGYRKMVLLPMKSWKKCSKLVAAVWLSLYPRFIRGEIWFWQIPSKKGSECATSAQPQVQQIREWEAHLPHTNYSCQNRIVVILDQAFPFPVTSLATFAADRLQIYLSQFSHICALFRLHLEGGTSQQPFKSCLAFLRIGTKQTECIEK